MKIRNYTFSYLILNGNRPESIIRQGVRRRGHFPVVLYGCETWSVTLREEQRLKVFENRVLRRIWTEERLSDRRLEKTT
jgi:hypothetical protein